MGNRFLQTFRALRSLGAGLAISTLPLSLVILPAKAVRFSDGTVHFSGVPLLGKVSTTDNQARAWSATYFFAIQIPANASEPLGRVVLQQTEGVESIDYNLKQTYAYVNGDRHQKTALQATQPDEKTLILDFNPPVPPGTTLTLAVRPDRNPRIGGVYLFGVTAFPAGEKASSQFVGYGRLQFYDNTFDRGFGGWWR
jgi:Protein of unknown function (DUF2808)